MVIGNNKNKNTNLARRELKVKTLLRDKHFNKLGKTHVSNFIALNMSIFDFSTLEL